MVSHFPVLWFQRGGGRAGLRFIYRSRVIQQNAAFAD
jgi:hypothetical protein